MPTPAGARRHLGDVISTHPTVGSNVEEVTHRNVRFQVWDLGGQDKLRKVWATYYCGAHAVVLVVDSTDRARLGVVRDELAAITSHEVRGCASPGLARSAPVARHRAPPRATTRAPCARISARVARLAPGRARRTCAARRCW